MTEVPQRRVLEGVVLGEPTKQRWRVRTSIDRGGFVVRCECRAVLHDGPYPPDVDELMTAHVAKEHAG